MPTRSLARWIAAAALALPAVAAPRPAAALQPLEDFVAAAKGANLDHREAQATAEQRAAEAKQAAWKLGPAFSAKAAYTRNQYESVYMGVTVLPHDQLDATLSLTVPIVDVASWLRVGAADATAEAAKVRAQATTVDVEKSVVRAYYQVVAVEATLAAAERALATAMESRAIVATRREAGAASELDVERARAEVERQKQVVAGAAQARAIARRSLETLTGVTPSEGAAALPDDALADEPALDALEPATSGLPSVRAAALEAKAASRNEGAAWAALAPTVAANATERLTNASGFTGHAATASVGIAATWNIDASTYFAAKAAGAARVVADVREKRAHVQARDEMHAAWQEVRAGLARVRAARAGAEASARAAKLARERYLAGTATQLDVQQAERDAFAGEVARIQAQADLSYARAAVRLASGRPR
jgi:outer membrane protein TolC